MQEIYQKTILKPIKFEGIGLHSGSKAKVNILPADGDHGIVFKRTDLKKDNLITANYKNVSSAKLCTTLKNSSGVTVSTVEHLMAAFYMSGIDNALDVYLGAAMGCAAIDNRTNLKCWGNYYLGDGSTTGSTTSVTVTETNGWGSDYTFDDVAIGQSSACAYNLATNQLFCWGLNADGQLGLGNTLTPYSTMQNTGSPF